LKFYNPNIFSLKVSDYNLKVSDYNSKVLDYNFRQCRECVVVTFLCHFTNPSEVDYKKEGGVIISIPPLSFCPFCPLFAKEFDLPMCFGRAFNFSKAHLIIIFVTYFAFFLKRKDEHRDCHNVPAKRLAQVPDKFLRDTTGPGRYWRESSRQPRKERCKTST
jgi:hypothetical protein